MTHHMGIAYINQSRNHNKWYIALPYTSCVYCIYGAFNRGSKSMHFYDPHAMSTIAETRRDHGYTRLGEVYVPGTMILHEDELYLIDAIEIRDSRSINYVMLQANTGHRSVVNSNFMTTSAIVEHPFRSSFLTLYPSVRAWYEQWSETVTSRGYAINQLDI